MAHTPGPWTAKWSEYREDTFIVKAGMPSNRVLASFDGDGDGPDEQSIADAHLIAAAPNMLAALNDVLAGWEALAAVIAQDDRVEDLEFGAFMKVRAAISKAEGRS